MSEPPNKEDDAAFADNAEKIGAGSTRAFRRPS